MELEINGKIYTLNEDLRLGVLYMMQKKPEDFDVHMKFFKEFLQPSPSFKEMLNFKESDTEKIFKAYGDLKKAQATDLKKKLST